MREIKFRAWDKEEKVLVDNVHFNGNCNKEWGCCFQDLLYDENNDRFIVMQYTGLKDKNGKEIYEEDIVKKDDGLLYEMRFRKDFARFEFMSIHLINDGNRKWCGIYGYPTPYDKEPDEEIGIIIGNIYENPELLTK